MSRFYSGACFDYEVVKNFILVRSFLFEMDFESDFMPKSKLTAAFKSLLLSVLYVGSLYVFGSSLPRFVLVLL